MYKTTQRTQERKDVRRRTILNAAADVFSTNGYHDATVKEIVERADVSVGTFYFYFKSKEDLFKELYESIAEEFRERTMSVVDVARFSMLKNYTRVMAATLWMYEQKRAIAGIMLRETASVPCLQALEAARMRAFTDTMAAWFKRFRSHEGVAIPDERIAARIYAGSYNGLVGAWLASEPDAPLTDCAFAFCVYHLQALRIPFAEDEVRGYIAQVLAELHAAEGGAPQSAGSTTHANGRENG